jgi:hypothetical protein
MSNFKSTLTFQYEYSKNDEEYVDKVIKEIENDLGGERHPYGARAGAIDLLTVLEFVFTFIVGTTLGRALNEYFSGLIKSDSAKKLGERHHEIIKNWLNDIENAFQNFIKSFKRKFHNDVETPTFEGKEKSIALRLSIVHIDLFIVLNQYKINDQNLDKLPAAIVKVLKYIAGTNLPEDIIVLQLYYDHNQNDWCYLFMPSRNAFGNCIDRMVNINTDDIIYFDSPEDFISRLKISEEEGLKLLVDPFRYR